MSEVVLYSYFRSSASYRLRIALAMKGIKYEYRNVDLVKDGGQQHGDDYKQMNSMEQVPTLLIDGLTLTQSLPIIEYLEETRADQGQALLPRDPILKFQARQLSEIVNSGIQPIQNLSVLQYLASDEIKGDKVKWGHYWIARGLRNFEKIVSKTAGKFCVGDEVSMADLCLVPQIYNANRFKVDMSTMPTINRIYEACLELDVFRVADPHVQPDCPEDMRK